MDELITDAQAEWLVAGVAALLLLSGLIAVAIGRAGLRERIGHRMTVLWLLAGPLVYLLWKLDAFLISWLGFDTLLRLGVELAGCLILGVLIGLWLRGDRKAPIPTPPTD